MPQDLKARIDNDFAYHAPTTTGRKLAHEDIRGAYRQFALMLADMLPEGRELSSALTNLEQAMFWSNAAIARHGVAE